MKVLIAEDEPITRRLLEESLRRVGFDVSTVCDGTAAWAALEQVDAPALAVLDWMMPGLDGLEVCRRVRARLHSRYVYVILLTSRSEREDRLSGLAAGADDFITKPCHPAELAARVRVGERILSLEARLDGKIRELEGALAHVKRLQGLIPICMHCKSVRGDQNTWQRVESYIQDHSDAVFTHSLCSHCLEVHYPADPEPT